MDSPSSQQADAEKHAGPGGLIFFAVLGVLYGVTRFLYKRKVQAEETARQNLPPEFSVWVANEAIHCQCRDGAVERLPINELVKVLVETNDSGPWGYDVWFVLEGKQDQRIAFPLEAGGKDGILTVLKQLPGFQMRGMNSTENATFECWPNPSK
ncbi:MAG: hypothetical protein EPO08_17320 [Rhodospirillaceae bacterium]|nr:MAG: hypothetical protein EPO08_17320 [Rhodospirillaceae bacterium]